MNSSDSSRELQEDAEETMDDRRMIVARASLVRCASRLVEKREQERRKTIGVLDPSAKQALANAALNAMAWKNRRPLAGLNCCSLCCTLTLPVRSDHLVLCAVEVAVGRICPDMWKSL